MRIEIIFIFRYMAPEFAASGKLTEKYDVYSYGVVLLELITGCKPVDSSQPLGDESLVKWVSLIVAGFIFKYFFLYYFILHMLAEFSAFEFKSIIFVLYQSVFNLGKYFYFFSSDSFIFGSSGGQITTVLLFVRF